MTIMKAAQPQRCSNLPYTLLKRIRHFGKQWTSAAVVAMTQGFA